jgi:hypothetical protein
MYFLAIESAAKTMHLFICWVLAPTNVTSDDACRRQFGVAVFHEPQINPQAHGIPL